MRDPPARRHLILASRAARNRCRTGLSRRPTGGGRRAARTSTPRLRRRAWRSARGCRLRAASEIRDRSVLTTQVGQALDRDHDDAARRERDQDRRAGGAVQELPGRKCRGHRHVGVARTAARPTSSRPLALGLDGAARARAASGSRSAPTPPAAAGRATRPRWRARDARPAAACARDGAPCAHEAAARGRGGRPASAGSVRDQSTWAPRRLATRDAAHGLRRLEHRKSTHDATRPPGR